MFLVKQYINLFGFPGVGASWLTRYQQEKFEINTRHKKT